MKRSVKPLEPLESHAVGQSLEADPYMSIRQMAFEFGVSRETVSNKLAAVRAWPAGIRNGYPVYHWMHWGWANYHNMRTPIGCEKCKCRRCKQLHLGNPDANA